MVGSHILCVTQRCRVNVAKSPPPRELRGAMAKFSHVTAKEKGLILRWQRQGKLPSEMASLLGRSVSTVVRQLASRNKKAGVGGYVVCMARAAQRVAIYVLLRKHGL